MFFPFHWFLDVPSVVQAATDITRLERRISVVPLLAFYPACPGLTNTAQVCLLWTYVPCLNVVSSPATRIGPACPEEPHALVQDDEM